MTKAIAALLSAVFLTGLLCAIAYAWLVDSTK